MSFSRRWCASFFLPGPEHPFILSVARGRRIADAAFHFRPLGSFRAAFLPARVPRARGSLPALAASRSRDPAQRALAGLAIILREDRPARSNGSRTAGSGGHSRMQKVLLSVLAVYLANTIATLRTGKSPGLFYNYLRYRTRYGPVTREGSSATLLGRYFFAIS